MSEAKIDIKIGQIQFSGTGEQSWIAQQLDKILSQAENLGKLVPPCNGSEDEGAEANPVKQNASIANKPLPAFLAEKKATVSQVKKFLATSVWLEAKGHKRIQTTDVTKALKTANQARLGNPADNLNKNVSKGYCEKDGKQFFVTDDGRKSL
jgi:hypothetical protein